MVFSTTYQSCKNSLVSKLNSIGINANENEGLTTLINKINVINEGIFLWTDYGGTSRSSYDSGTIYAIVVENGVFKPNVDISFCGIYRSTPIQRTIVVNEELPVGCKYSFASIPSFNSGDNIYLDKGHKIKLSRDFYGDKGFYYDFNEYGQGSGSCLSVSNVSVENNIITINYAGGSRVVDGSRCDMSSILSNVSATINDYSSLTTNNNGIGSFDFEFDGEESGTKIITARCGDKTGTLEFTIS